MSSVPQGYHDGSPTQSQASPQQPSSTEIPIETLIDHLLNAKKALNSIDTLWRANEIVSTAQAALEESVIISARTGFLRRGITQQVRLIEKTRNGLEQVKRDGDAEFTVCPPIPGLPWPAVYHHTVQKLTAVIGRSTLPRRSRQTPQIHHVPPRLHIRRFPVATCKRRTAKLGLIHRPLLHRHPPFLNTHIHGHRRHIQTIFPSRFRRFGFTEAGVAGRY